MWEKPLKVAVAHQGPRIKYIYLHQWPRLRELFRGITASRESMQVMPWRDVSLGIRLTTFVEFVVFVPSRTQGVVVDPNYPVGHPTSAARLAQPAWGPPPWADGTHPVPPYPIPGPPAYYAPYYHPGMPPPLALANAQLHPHTPGYPYAPPSSSPDNETCVPSDSEAEIATSPKRSREQVLDHPDESRPHESSVPVIDPSLETSEAFASDKSPVSLAITSAAVQAVFGDTRRIEKQKRVGGVVTTSESREPSPHTFAISGDATVEVIANPNSSVSPEPPPSDKHPTSLLTEDGETMLHPGEWIPSSGLHVTLTRLSTHDSGAPDSG